MPKKKVVTEEAMEAAKAAPQLGDIMRIASESAKVTCEADYLRCASALRAIASQEKTLLEGDARLGWRGWESLVGPVKTAYDALRDARDASLEKLRAARERYEKAMSDWIIGCEQAYADVAQNVTSEMLEAENRVRKLRENGDNDSADLMEAEMMLTTAALESAGNAVRPAVAGVTVMPSYEFEITDMRAFLEDVLDGALPLEGLVLGKIQPLLSARDSLLREFKKSMGANFQVRGLKVTEKKAFRVQADE